jgi:hypothetical protein
MEEVALLEPGVQVPAGPVQIQPFGPARLVRQGTDVAHVENQNDRGQDGEQERDQHPVVPEQAPGGAEGHDQPREQRGQGQGDDGVPACHVHGDPGRPHRVGLPAGHGGDAQSEVRDDAADPPDREGEMGGEGELAEARWHGHGWRHPYSAPGSMEDVWARGPLGAP